MSRFAHTLLMARVDSQGKAPAPSIGVVAALKLSEREAELDRIGAKGKVGMGLHQWRQGHGGESYKSLSFGGDCRVTAEQYKKILE